jgi:hypothetical protein
MSLFLIKKTHSHQAKGVIRLDSVKTEVVLRKHFEIQGLELIPITPAFLRLAKQLGTPLRAIQITTKLNENETF